MKSSRQYILIPLQWLDQMTLDEAAAYAYLYGFLSNGLEIYQNQNEIAKALRFSLRKFTRVLKTLREDGFVETSRNATGVSYRLLETGTSGVIPDVKNGVTAYAENDTSVTPELTHAITTKSAQPITPESTQPKYYNRDFKSKDYTIRNNNVPPDPSEQLTDLWQLYYMLADEISRDTPASEALQRRYNQSKNALLLALRQFQDKLVFDGVKTKTPSDYRKHFNNWYNKQNSNQINNQNTTKNEKPNSTSNEFSKLSAGFIRSIAEGIANGNL